MYSANTFDWARVSPAAEREYCSLIEPVGLSAVEMMDGRVNVAAPFSLLTLNIGAMSAIRTEWRNAFAARPSNHVPSYSIRRSMKSKPTATTQNVIFVFAPFMLCGVLMSTRSSCDSGSFRSAGMSRRCAP